MAYAGARTTRLTQVRQGAKQLSANASHKEMVLTLQPFTSSEIVLAEVTVPNAF